MEIPLNPNPNGPRRKPAETPAVERMRRYMESLPELPSPKEEIRAGIFWKSLFAEFLATMLLVIFTYDSHRRMTSSDIGHVKCAFSYCSSAAVLVQIFGTVSSTHMNPAVTISLMATRRISVLRTGFYIACQIFASLVGAAVGYALDSPRNSDMKENYAQAGLEAIKGPRTITPNASMARSSDDLDVEWINIFGLEFLGTAIIVMTTLSCLHPMTVNDASFRPLYVGISYSAGVLLTRQHTGCSLNPARWLGISLVTNGWDHHWVYWISSTLAGLLGAFTYEYVQSNSEADSSAGVLRRSFRRRSNGRLAGDNKENNGHINGVDRALMQNSVEMTLTSPVADYHM